MEKRYRYSESFKSFQGEGGPELGVPCVWIRFWGCNFECAGFSRETATSENALSEEGEKTSADMGDELQGCDSRYSWAKDHIAESKTATAEELTNEIEALLRSPNNPQGLFCDAGVGIQYRLVFTGGEPLLSQSAICEVLGELYRRNNLPKKVCIETNGTQQLRQKIANLLSSYTDLEIFWSVSPKLSHSGESWEEAMRPDVVSSYLDISKSGQLKFVVDGSDDGWREVNRALSLFRDAGVTWPAYVMPVGETKKQQETLNELVAVQALENGFGFCPRVHCWVFNNRRAT